MEIPTDVLKRSLHAKILSVLQVFSLFTLSIRFVATLLRSCKKPRTELRVLAIQSRRYVFLSWLHKAWFLGTGES
jgi:hypothetical protein